MGTGVIVLGVLALIGGVAYIGWMQEKKRKEALQAAALALGFTYSEEAHWGEFESLPLFDRGRSRRGRNALVGTTAGNAVTVMDYQYTTGSGKNSHTHHQTVALFPQAGQSLPDFELSPENFLHKIGQVFGFQDIDFEEDAEFSKRFLLRGEDETRIRATFTPSVRAACGNFTEWTIQVRGGKVAVFKPSRRCDAAELPSFLANGLRIVSALGVKS